MSVTDSLACVACTSVMLMPLKTGAVLSLVVVLSVDGVVVVVVLVVSGSAVVVVIVALAGGVVVAVPATGGSVVAVVLVVGGSVVVVVLVVSGSAVVVKSGAVDSVPRFPAESTPTMYTR